MYYVLLLCMCTMYEYAGRGGRPSFIYYKVKGGPRQNAGIPARFLLWASLTHRGRLRSFWMVLSQAAAKP